mmetsp:Transcript_22240/g.71087  ORF Transcript_22240/g.71087 Transcript_22240/m.71087 type:complete len:210 (+) Transcript_22240:2-631(+)
MALSQMDPAASWCLSWTCPRRVRVMSSRLKQPPRCWTNQRGRSSRSPNEGVAPPSAIRSSRSVVLPRPSVRGTRQCWAAQLLPLPLSSFRSSSSAPRPSSKQSGSACASPKQSTLCGGRPISQPFKSSAVHRRATKHHHLWSTTWTAAARTTPKTIWGRTRTTLMKAAAARLKQISAMPGGGPACGFPRRQPIFTGILTPDSDCSWQCL